MYFNFKYGWVFGISNIAAFLMALFCGKFEAKIGVKFLLNLAVFLLSSVDFAFGFLVYASNRIVFLGLSYALIRDNCVKKSPKFYLN